MSEHKPSAAMVLETAALGLSASLSEDGQWDGWVDARHALHRCALDYAASCGQLDAKERAELEALRQMRDGLVGLRDELERGLPHGPTPEGRSLGEHALVTCYALLTMCGGQR